MRRGELLALEWRFVDLEQKIAHLPDTKNGRVRNVPLSRAACEVLRILPRAIDGRVFPITAEYLKQAFKRAVDSAGLEDFHFHDLRHEATSRMAQRLPNLIELASVTGHQDLRMLQRYYHPNPAELAVKLG
jgi:integrase